MEFVLARNSLGIESFKKDKPVQFLNSSDGKRRRCGIFKIDIIPHSVHVLLGLLTTRGRRSHRSHGEKHLLHRKFLKSNFEC